MSKKDWERSIDEQIREAMERGDFDNLPGKGKPLDLSANPYAADREMAFKVLKDAGYAPEWIEKDKEIRRRLEQAEARLARQWEWHQERLRELGERQDSRAEAEKKRSAAGWREAELAFEAEAAAINVKIAELNLEVPSPRFQRLKIDAAREVARITGERR